MLTVNVICVGKLKEKFYLAAVEEYSKRLSRSCKLNLLELPEERLPETPSDAQIEAALRKEFQLIQSKLPKGGVVIGIKEELNIPIKYIGVGEQIDDLRPFDSKDFVEALFEDSPITKEE